MNSKQRWMGGVVLLGGGVLLAALLLKGKEEIDQKHVQVPPTEQVQQQRKNPANQDLVQLQPLAVDVETEKRLLEEQRRARERAVAEQEARAAEFLQMQQQAEAEAARKAAEEYATLNALRNGNQESSDNIPPELVDEKAKSATNTQNKPQNTLNAQQSEAQKKEAQRKQEAEHQVVEKKRSELEAKQKAEAERKAAAEKKAQEEQKRKAAEKKAAEEKNLKAEAERKKSQEEAKKKAEAEKARKLLEEGDDDRQWMVQVALAANEANADAIVSKLRAKGYKVTRSPTSKGIRIMVGPAKDRDTADEARKKIVNDASLNMKSAWVIDWVPLDKR